MLTKEETFKTCEVCGKKLVIIDPEALKAIIKAVTEDLNQWVHTPSDNYHGARVEDVENALQYLKQLFEL